MEMSLREAVEIISQESVDDTIKFLRFEERTRLYDAIIVLYAFCQSVVECKRMPKWRLSENRHPNVDVDGSPWGWVVTNNSRQDGIFSWSGKKERDQAEEICKKHNEACDLHQAWAEKMLDVERIRKVIDYYNEEVDGSKITWEAYRNQFATAIVAGLKEGK